MNHASSPTASAHTSAPAPAPAPKPIRFVTNNDGPYAKRRRINSACLTCRRKKTRCSGERPVCGTCIQNKHECAGYGNETEGASLEPSRESKKARRESNESATAPARKSKQELATRPPLSHQNSATSLDLEPSPNVQPLPSHNANPVNPVNPVAGEGASGLTLSTRNRMPYFRYFGPTAIMPGFKQMVVKVRGKKQNSAALASTDPLGSSPAQAPSIGSPPLGEASTPLEMPVYDTSPVPPSPLITHLCKLFFVHLGCSFPFLQRERFLRDLEEKQVDAILVDAICALAARFSTHPLLTGRTEANKGGDAETSKTLASEHGHAFAQRARSAIPDAFPCPSVAVVQAVLLLAYDEFGANHDSGLWMYLGIAIRMAQDLGMQTLEGLKYEGRGGPTPKSVKTDRNSILSSDDHVLTSETSRPHTLEDEDQRAVERERLDTFWSIFFLDRVISSGTGRPVTLKDRDIEISFPALSDVDPVSGWPQPFPVLIRIIHLYGRVTDLLNGIKEKTDITEDTRKQLDTLEFHLTEIYQGLSPKLHFNAVNFQHYVKLNQGTNFLLLHCWFHTLIVLLHQPTLLKTFEGSFKHLSENSRELSMSSAKTIADILSFTDLIDEKTGAGNPFTCQPIYIAACAFLKETALHSASSRPQSRPSSPPLSQQASSKQSLDHIEFDRLLNAPKNGRLGSTAEQDQKQAHKHTLLASAANQNYQRCYRALKSLETYWDGVKYILTVLDQKAKGVVDPLLYTREEMESALEVPSSEPSFKSPGWRRKLSWGIYLTSENNDVENNAKVPAAVRKGAHSPAIPGSPMPIASQAIGWSLTGTMNSPSTNVAVMYTSENSGKRDIDPALQSNQPSIASVLSSAEKAEPRIKFEEPTTPAPSSAFQKPLTSLPSFEPPSMPPPQTNFSNIASHDSALVSDADLLLNLHSTYGTNSPNATSNQPALQSTFSPGSSAIQLPAFSPNAFGPYPAPGEAFGNMVIDSQEIDMSALSTDMMPWDLEYLPDFNFYNDVGFNVSGDQNIDAGA